MLYLTYNSAIRNQFKSDASMSRYSALISAVISFITIQLLSPLCSWISVKLNDYENHKTPTQYHDSLITKNLTFEFVNYYGIIAYIAVGRAWVFRSNTGLFGESTLADSCFSIDPNSDSSSCMMDLTIQMAVIFIARAIVRHILNFLEPIYSRFFEGMKYGGFSGGIKSIRSKYTYKASNTAEIPQLYVDMSLTSVDIWKTHLDGYDSATVQMGFIMLFSLAFPLAPILAAIHNIIQWRIDAHNLLYRYKRPFALQAANIGVWEYWIVIIAYLGVVMNALILSFTSQYIFDRIKDFSERTQNEQWQVRLLFIIIFEHAVLFVVLIINILIPNMPDRAIISLKRQAYIESFLSGELKKLS